MTRTAGFNAVTVAASAVLATGLLAGCGNGLTRSSQDTDPKISHAPSDTASEATPSRQASDQASSPTSSADAGDTGQPTPTTSSTATAASTGPTTCAAGDLGVGIERPDGGGAAGSSYVVLTFRNRSARTCTLDGHPGVSFVGKGNGSQIGAPATRTGAVRTVHLTPGATSTALLQVSNAGNYDRDECVPTTADGFRVYPPDSRASVFVRFRVEACQGGVSGGSQLTVSEVRPARS